MKIKNYFLRALLSLVLLSLFFTRCDTEEGNGQDPSENTKPVFDQEEYRFTVPENFSTLETVGMISASPSDAEGVFISYEITSGNEDDIFFLDRDTGKLSIQNPLDFEFKSEYVLTIRASTNHGVETSIMVQIMVENINDESLFFKQYFYEFRFKSDLAVGNIIGTVKAVDPDGIDNIFNYSIIGGNEDNIFEIESSTGDIKLIDKTTIDTSSVLPVSHSFSIEASSGEEADIAIVFIRITPSDDIVNSIIRIPRSVRFTIPVDHDLTAPVGTIPIENTRTYSIFDGNTDGTTSNIFKLDMGKFTVNAGIILANLAETDYTLTIEASDPDGAIQFPVFIEIKIPILYNDPTFQMDFYQFKILNNASVGDEVGTVTATDPFPGASITGYSIIGGASSAFSIDNNGVITVASSLASFPRQSYLRVQADSSRSGKMADVSVYIQVDPVPVRDPVFEQDIYQWSISDTLPSGSLIGTVVATSPDKGIEINSYSIIVDSILFSINNEGEIRTKSGLSGVSRLSYRLSIMATDTRGRSSVSDLMIRIIESDTNPVFSESNYNFSIDEGKELNRIVGEVSATIASPSDSIVFYMITRGNTDHFRIDNLGEIRSRVPLDFEDIPRYTLTVQTSTSRNRSSSVSVIININDQPDDPPSFGRETYILSLPEDIAQNTVVTSVTATDPNPGGRITGYSIISGNEENKFMIDNTGVLKIAETLDFETTPTYTLGIRARNLILRESIAMVSIILKNRNDTPPVFSQPNYTFNVDENVVNGTIVGSVMATDPDGGDVTYSLMGTSDTFTLDSNTGMITTKADLNFETTAVYDLTIIATDTAIEGDSRTMTKNVNVRIIVTDVNEADPEFPSNCCNIAFTEEVVASNKVVPVGRVLGRVTAIDPEPDGGGMIERYEIISITDTAGTGADYSGLFAVSTETTANKGAIFTTTAVGGLTFENMPAGGYLIILRAFDSQGGTADANVTLIIHNLEQNAPDFAASATSSFSASSGLGYSFVVPENTASGTSIAMVDAIDPNGDDTMITYSIMTPPSGLPFTISSSSGEGNITVNGALDYDTNKRYEFTIQATDTEGLSTKQFIVVEIGDV